MLNDQTAKDLSFHIQEYFTMELHDKLTSITIAFLISVTGLAVSVLGILTALNGNPVGYSEVAFGILFFICGVDLIKDTRVQNVHNLQAVPSGISIELNSYGTSLIGLNKQKANAQKLQKC